ncbi:MAG: hypothetical protein U0807_13605 [Candidatus Binatia bacterium]
MAPARRTIIAILLVLVPPGSAAADTARHCRAALVRDAAKYAGIVAKVETACIRHPRRATDTTANCTAGRPSLVTARALVASRLRQACTDRAVAALGLCGGAVTTLAVAAAGMLDEAECRAEARVGTRFGTPYHACEHACVSALLPPPRGRKSDRCRDACAPGQICDPDGTCRDPCPARCQQWDREQHGCVDACPHCGICNPSTGDCIPCATCEQCDEATGICRSSCGSCEICENATNTCRPCNKCERCQGNQCVAAPPCPNCGVCDAEIGCTATSRCGDDPCVTCGADNDCHPVQCPDCGRCDSLSGGCIPGAGCGACETCGSDSQCHPVQCPDCGFCSLQTGSCVPHGLCTGCETCGADKQCHPVVCPNCGFCDEVAGCLTLQNCLVDLCQFCGPDNTCVADPNCPTTTLPDPTTTTSSTTMTTTSTVSTSTTSTTIDPMLALTIDSAVCDGNPNELCVLDVVTATGTVSGAVGARLLLPGGSLVQSYACGAWAKIACGSGGSCCRRTAGQPATAQWSITIGPFGCMKAGQNLTLAIEASVTFPNTPSIIAHKVTNRCPEPA